MVNVMADQITLQKVLSSLDWVVLARRDEGDFEVLGTPPSWFTEFFPNKNVPDCFNPQEYLFFIENFIYDIDEALDKGEVSYAGPWCEAADNGEEYNLSATALWIEQRPILLVQRIGNNRLQYQAVFQKAREYSLNYERLQRDAEKKEILLHTIVHDLAGPLTAIKGTLSLVNAKLLNEEHQSEMVESAKKQCQVQESMIRSILEVFSSELESFDAKKIDPLSCPSLLQCAEGMVKTLKAAYRDKYVRLSCESTLDAQYPWRVVGDAAHLNRVISNLLENALRYSPKGSNVLVSVEQHGDQLQLNVDDEGGGVPDEIRDQLFDKFSGGSLYGGKAGIGLYFCRITVNKWGGEIGYRESPSGKGSRFWFRLPLIN